jgi:hypothetical protein
VTCCRDGVLCGDGSHKKEQAAELAKETDQRKNHSLLKTALTVIIGLVYRVFQKALYNLESLYKFAQRTYTTF